MNDRLPLGIAMVLLAFFLFSCVDVSAKWLSISAIPVIQVAFFRFFGHLVITSVQAAGRGFKNARISREQAPLILLRGALLAATTLCNFVALRYLPLTTAATITFSAPVFVCALSGPLLGEKVGPWRWGAIVVGFIGVVIALRPESGFHWSMLFSVAAALCFALYALMSRKLAGKVSVGSLQFYSGVVGTVVLGPLALSTWVWPETSLQWGLLAGIGCIAWVGHEFFTRAHGYAPASTLTPFSYVLIAYMSFWGWMVFDQLPDTTTLVAAAIMIAAGVVIWWRETSAKRAVESV